MSSEVSLAGAQDDREPSIEELKRELVEAREQQAATSDILRIISGSSIGAQPVFDAIVASCQRLLRGGTAAITLLVDRRLKVVAFRRTKPEADAAMLAFSHSLDGHSPISVVARERTPFVIDDIETDTRVPAINRDAIRRRGSRSALFVPMLHQDKTVGTISVGHPQPSAFTEYDVRLLQTFADQAVIAIENTRLFEAEQASKRELQEALEQQTATADVLKVISRSTFDIQTVLDTLVQSAVRLCGAESANIFRWNHSVYELAASFGYSRQYMEFIRPGRTHAAGRGSLIGRIALEGVWFIFRTLSPIRNTISRKRKNSGNGAPCSACLYSGMDHLSAQWP